MDVTKKNFDEILPEIKQRIKTCTFISVDAEYTGLYAEEIKDSNSLFDSAPQRYSRLKRNMGKFCTCQIGIAIFEKDRDSKYGNGYLVNAYNFSVFPVAFDNFAKREMLTTQVSCLNFLTRNDFDFNKFIREGVPYLNKEKKLKLQKFLKANRHFMNTCEYLDEAYFPSKKEYLQNSDVTEIIDRLEGFSKLIEIIHKSKKPVVGHNLLMDLLLMHQQFFAELPDSYEDFKKSLHDLFPNIYDTKCIAWGVHNLRQQIDPEDKTLSDTNLFALYSNLSALLMPVLKPFIDPLNETSTYKEALLVGQTKNLETVSIASCHNAAFDAVVTGAVFLKLGYLACRPKIEPDYKQGMHPTATEIFNRVSYWKDEVNMARALIRNIHLSKPDPISERPDWIRVLSSPTQKFVDPVLLRQHLSKYGDIEIEVISQDEALIACGGFGCFRNSWKILSSKGYRLKKERGSDFSQNVLTWGIRISVITAFGLGVWYLLNRKRI